jgi:hypothetical protein
MVEERAMPVCPACGNDGTEDDILYLAWLDGDHSIRVVKGGVVEVEKAYPPLDPLTGVAYPSFVCHRGAGYGEGPVCGHHWPVNAPVVIAEAPRDVAARAAEYCA